MVGGGPEGPGGVGAAVVGGGLEGSDGADVVVGGVAPGGEGTGPRAAMVVVVGRVAVGGAVVVGAVGSRTQKAAMKGSPSRLNGSASGTASRTSAYCPAGSWVVRVAFAEPLAPRTTAPRSSVTWSEPSTKRLWPTTAYVSDPCNV